MNTLKVGDQVLIIDGAFQGHTGHIRELDGAWIFLTLRDGRLLWLSAGLVQVCDGNEGPN